MLVHEAMFDSGQSTLHTSVNLGITGKEIIRLPLLSSPEIGLRVAQEMISVAVF
jgi:hypothetical protein